MSTARGTPPAAPGVPLAAVALPEPSRCASLVLVALVETVTRMASPSDSPICWPVMSSGEASPASSRRTPETAVNVSGTKDVPMPMAMNSVGSGTFQ